MTPVAVDAVLDLDRITWVYNLTVEGLHTYYVGADPVLVHNAGKKRATSRGGASRELHHYDGQASCHHTPAHDGDGQTSTDSPSILMDHGRPHQRRAAERSVEACRRPIRARQAQLTQAGTYDEAFADGYLRDDIQSAVRSASSTKESSKP